MRGFFSVTLRFKMELKINKIIQFLNTLLTACLLQVFSFCLNSNYCTDSIVWYLLHALKTNNVHRFLVLSFGSHCSIFSFQCNILQIVVSIFHYFMLILIDEMQIICLINQINEQWNTILFSSEFRQFAKTPIHKNNLTIEYSRPVYIYYLILKDF